MILLAQSNLVEGVMLAVLGLVIGWLLLRTHRQLARRRRADAPLVRVARPEEGERGHGLQAPQDVVRWEVQMHEIARGLSAQLDSKMGALQALIAEADRAAARLEAAARSAEPAGQKGCLGLYADGDSRGVEGDGPVSADEQTRTESDLPVAPSAAEPGSQAAALRPSAPSGPTTDPSDDPSQRPSARRAREEVYMLADYGLATLEIARRVGVPVGEVELILGLRGKKGSELFFGQ